MVIVTNPAPQPVTQEDLEPLEEQDCPCCVKGTLYSKDACIINIQCRQK